MCVLVAQLEPLAETPWTIATQAPCPWTSPGKSTGGVAIPSKGFSDLKYQAWVSYIAGRLI